MTSKEAIEIVQDSSMPYETLVNDELCERYDEANSIVLSLAERMAMYEWWWELMVDEAERCGIADIPCFVYPLDSEQFERVMKAWKENA